MAFLSGLLSSALPFIAKGVGGALSGALGAVQRGEGLGGALKGAALGGLSGLVEQPALEPARPAFNVQSQPAAEAIPAFIQQRPLREEMRMRMPAAPQIKIPSKFISKLKKKQQKSKR